MGREAVKAHGPDDQKFFGSFFQKRTASLFGHPAWAGGGALPLDRGAGSD
jgi:hypothetical protein